MKKVLTTAPEQPRPSLRDQRPLVQQIVIAIALVLAISLLPVGAVKWVLAAAGIGFMAVRGFQLNQALQPPVMGVGTYQPASRPAQEETVVLDMPSEEPPPPRVADEIVTEAEDERALYEERAHVLLLFAQLLRAAPAAMMLWGFAAVQSILAGMPDRETTQGLLVALVVGSTTVLLLSKAKEKQFGWMRKTAKVILAGSLVSAASLTWAEALALSLIALILAGTYVFARRWAKWYCTKYIVTENLIAIERKSPWYFFLEDSRPFLPTNKLTSVDVKRSSVEKFLEGFGIRCGTVEADTPGQKDERFHRMPYIRDPERMANILSAMVVGK